jgi:multiple sugar transport system substrate-binding protein
MLRRLLTFSMLMIVFILFTAPSLAQGEKLVVASFYAVDQTAGWDGVVAKFQEIHPGVEVEVQVTAFDEYLPKLLTQVAGGDAPDVVGVENTPFPQFVDRGILMDVTDLLETDTTDFSKDDFFPYLLDRYTYDGKVYGIPYDAQPFGLLYYNPALFDAAGVDYPTAEWTWDDALDAAKKLTVTNADGTISQYGWAACDSWNYFLYTGGGAMVDDLRNPTTSMLDTPESIAAIQFHVDLMHTEKVAPSPQTLEGVGCASLFTTGQAAMFTGGFWEAVFNPEPFATMGVHIEMGPVKSEETRVYPTGGTAYAILEASDQKELAWDFIKLFLGLTGYEAAYAAAAYGSIYPPAHIPSFEWYAEQPIEFLDTIQPNGDMIPFVRFAPYALKWPEIQSKCVNPDMDLVMRNELPIAETMAKISACVNDELAG